MTKNDEKTFKLQQERHNGNQTSLINRQLCPNGTKSDIGQYFFFFAGGGGGGKPFFFALCAIIFRATCAPLFSSLRFSRPPYALLCSPLPQARVQVLLCPPYYFPSFEVGNNQAHFRLHADTSGSIYVCILHQNQYTMWSKNIRL